MKLELDFTNVEFDESMSDLDSTIAKNFKERLTGEVIVLDIRGRQ